MRDKELDEIQLKYAKRNWSEDKEALLIARLASEVKRLQYSIRLMKTCAHNMVRDADKVLEYEE